MNIKYAVETGIALFGALLGGLLGGFDGFLKALILFMVIDYITGLMIAISTKSISSSIGFKGIFKKMLMGFC